MARTWLFNNKSFTVKVKNVGKSAAHQLEDCEASLECPNCRYHVDNITVDWPGLPLGVKFDPTDAELLKHLAAKCGVGSRTPHQFINDFIPTIEGKDGICYAHPKCLPGARKDGRSVHFFHRTMKAYSTGQRKRRKVLNDEEHARWHKTGRTKSVMENGIRLGFKKIMVLYKRSKRGSKSKKSNWVMHQYHLGSNEDEKDGEYVVSKIFYQIPKLSGKKKNDNSKVDSGVLACEAGPLYLPKSGQSFLLVNVADPVQPPLHEPKTTEEASNGAGPLYLPKSGQSFMLINVADPVQPPAHEQKTTEEASNEAPASGIVPQDIAYPITTWLAGESPVVGYPDLDYMYDSFLCREITCSSSPIHVGNPGLVSFLNNDPNSNETENNGAPSLPNLENTEMFVPPDIEMTDFQFDSQDSWVNRM